MSGFDITYQVESIAMVRNECWALIAQHYDEIAQFKQVQRLDPDWETYETLEKMGKLWLMTVRDDGRLIGYIVMLLSRAMHYRGLLLASEDIHFLVPEYRQGMIGYRLLKYALQAMKEKGVGMTVMRTKAKHSHAALFERLGGELQDLVYVFVS